MYLFSHVFARRGTWILLDILTCDQPTTASLAGGDSLCWMVQALYDPGPDSDVSQGKKSIGACLSPKLMRFLLLPLPQYWDVRLKSALITYCTGWALLLIAVISLWSGSWYRRSPDDPVGRVTKYRAFVRWLIVYLFGASAVCLWHGIWYWADAWILPASPVASYWTTSLVGSTASFLVCGGNALLAPPAIFIIDGPGHNPPPIGVTLLSSYHSITIPYNERPPKLRTRVIFLDLFCSFAMLPFAVVWFWRGSWLILDNYLWGFVPESTLIHNSILWGFLLAVAFIGITSEPVFARLTKKMNNRHVLGAAGRLRTYILAWGNVSFWRCVWYIWDEFSGTHWKTALSSHVIGLVVLTIMGCVSSIAAPVRVLQSFIPLMYGSLNISMLINHNKRRARWVSTQSLTQIAPTNHCSVWSQYHSKSYLRLLSVVR